MLPIIAPNIERLAFFWGVSAAHCFAFPGEADAAAAGWAASARLGTLTAVARSKDKVIARFIAPSPPCRYGAKLC